jgi:hypothetical protein
MALIKKYKADREIIYQMERSLLGRKWEVSFTLGDFLQGTSVKNKNLIELVTLENAVVDACKYINVILNALAKIGQEEVIEI